jgi:hypothetical protein
LVVVFLAMAVSPVPVTAESGFNGGGAVPHRRLWPRDAAGGPAGAAVGTSPRPYAFFPLAANLWRDSLVHDFVDVDGPPAIANGRILDWDCTQYAYDGHTGQDGYIRTFDEQDIGVPAFGSRSCSALIDRRPSLRDSRPSSLHPHGVGVLNTPDCEEGTSDRRGESRAGLDRPLSKPRFGALAQRRS